MQTLPVIDIAGLNAPDPATRRHVTAQLGQACREVGFFYATGHGIPDPVRRAVFDAAHAVFALSPAEKAGVSVTLSPHNRGYVGFATERLNEHAGPDQKEAFNIGLELPPDDPELRSGSTFRGANLWPTLPGFRDALLEYYDACGRVMTDIHRGFALDLALDEDFFAPKLARPASILRLLHYPATAEDGGLGAGEHTDYGNLTLLATDGVAGLQVRTLGGQWIDAPHVDGAFICNIADCLMRWTNDVYRSTPHRVLRPKAERYSVAFFGDANPDALVEAIPSCIPPGTRPLYPSITCGAYIQQRLTATYEHLQNVQGDSSPSPSGRGPG